MYYYKIEVCTVESNNLFSVGNVFVYGGGKYGLNMYKKCMVVLLLINMIALVAAFNITGISVNRILSTPAFQLNLRETLNPPDETSYKGFLMAFSSGQRVISYNVVEKEDCYEISEEDYEVLLRIVEAEAGGEDIEGKMLVAGVVMNRVESDEFPDTIKEVVFQRSEHSVQFSPAYSGRYYTVVVSEETIEAVNRVLEGEDITGGALYFAARQRADSEKMRWFDENLTFLFAHGGHEFFY